MAKTIPIDYIAMYNDRIQVNDGVRAMAGLSANDNRAQQTGPASWAGAIREEKMRYRDKFVDLGGAEGRASFNPIAHVEVSGNQTTDVRRKILREKSRAQVTQCRAAAAAANERTRPATNANGVSTYERLLRECAEAHFDEPVHPSPSNRVSEPPKGGIAGPDYYAQHQALDRTLLPRRMPAVGYSGHLRRTKESVHCFGTSKWRPQTPPSRQAQAFAVWENARRMAEEARRPNDFCANDPFAGMDGKQGTSPFNPHVQPRDDPVWRSAAALSA